MIFKVLYQDTLTQQAKRETTKVIYVKANNESDARRLVEKNTKYNIEFVEEISGNHLKYEENEPGFKITKFN
ncbi:UPF0356 protein [Philodulcilactobacillus myokoensis]|uniref:DNA-directed RNA polymerase subunit epsilon n=1 Tax=Philodulcilactobacillus myokoensis TaxID=2929573 RepID=A0A9W6ESG3_9LACO|nr:DNA-directed RNA polymerase subunit epsilon [Philodulcilactobacillus myokoensis]GLB47001.1 UPF0356 protein [Philodulcilactobacillus myokoensis]